MKQNKNLTKHSHWNSKMPCKKIGTTQYVQDAFSFSRKYSGHCRYLYFAPYVDTNKQTQTNKQTNY